MVAALDGSGPLWQFLLNTDCARSPGACFPVPARGSLARRAGDVVLSVEPLILQYGQGCVEWCGCLEVLSGGVLGQHCGTHTACLGEQAEHLSEARRSGGMHRRDLRLDRDKHLCSGGGCRRWAQGRLFAHVPTQPDPECAVLGRVLEESEDRSAGLETCLAPELARIDSDDRGVAAREPVSGSGRAARYTL